MNTRSHLVICCVLLSAAQICGQQPRIVPGPEDAGIREGNSQSNQPEKKQGVTDSGTQLQARAITLLPPLPPPKNQAEVVPLAERLAAQQIYLWTNDAARKQELAQIRPVNPEWDLMSRSFVVWALANRCLRDPKLKSGHLVIIDSIIDDTIASEKRHGVYHFLMPYARARPFVARPPRSLFVDGEIALMLAARRMVEEKDSYKGPLDQRVRDIVRRIEAGPVLCAESYPDECWIFCNFRALQTSLDVFASPEVRQGRLRYAAGNEMGDAVILYAASLGPLWEKARKPAAKVPGK